MALIFMMLSKECYLVKSAVHGLKKANTRRVLRDEIIGKAMDGRTIGIICRTTSGGKARIITVPAGCFAI